MVIMWIVTNVSGWEVRTRSLILRLGGKGVSPINSIMMNLESDYKGTMMKKVVLDNEHDPLIG